MATQTMAATQNIFAPKVNATKAAPTPRIRTYKEFLTPALHRRFTTAAAALLLFCWLDAAILSTSPNWFWKISPLGFTGVRALMFFISCLAVFILRVAGMHFGERTTTSPAGTIFDQFAGTTKASSTLFTIGCYLFSGWWFGEVYLWTRAETDLLGMLQPAQTYERPQLNENPIFLRCLFPIVALIQAIQHLRHDCDRVNLSLPQDSAAQKIELAAMLRRQPTSFEKLPPPFRILTERWATLLLRTAELTFVGILAGFILYMLLLRTLAWEVAYSFARPLVRDLPPSAPPSGFHGWRLLIQTPLTVFTLLSLWGICNAIFEAVVAQKPLKKGQPLSSEVKDARGVILHKSKDPNGSLLTGLDRKNEVIRSFAFWELYLICSKFETRRKTIYLEVDRSGDSTWSQVCASSLKQLEDVQTRIKIAAEPFDSKQKQAELELRKQQHQHLIGYGSSEALGLKKIADQSVRNDGALLTKQKPDLINAIGGVAKSLGQSPGAENPVSPRARQALQWGTERILSPEDRKRYSRESIQGEASGYITKLLETPVGWLFRQTFARQAKAIIFGVPYSNRCNMIHAVKSLSLLAVCSLKEDDFGQVQKDVAKIVRTFTETIRGVEKLMRDLRPSWTDVTFQEKDRSIPEVNHLLDVLKMGLQEIILAFDEYASTIGLSKKEVREAKEAAIRVSARLPLEPPPPPPRTPEMEQAPAGPRQRRW